MDIKHHAKRSTVCLREQTKTNSNLNRWLICNLQPYVVPRRSMHDARSTYLSLQQPPLHTRTTPQTLQIHSVLAGYLHTTMGFSQLGHTALRSCGTEEGVSAGKIAALDASRYYRQRIQIVSAKIRVVDDTVESKSSRVVLYGGLSSVIHSVYDGWMGMQSSRV